MDFRGKRALFVLVFALASCHSSVESPEIKNRLFFHHRENGMLERVDKYNRGSIISSAVFDSTGDFLKSTYLPKFEPKRDSLLFGEAYVFKAGFDSEPLGTTRIIVGYYDDKRKTIGDTLVYMVLPDNKLTETLALIPKHEGNNVIVGEIEDYFVHERDSMKIGYTNFFEFETKFFVESDK